MRFIRFVVRCGNGGQNRATTGAEESRTIGGLMPWIDDADKHCGCGTVHRIELTWFVSR